jgi:cation diffusion facilitator family transporter
MNATQQPEMAGARQRELVVARQRELVTARQRDVAMVLLRVLVLNLAVAAAKLVLGYATGAVSVISDGFHSLTDSASNIMGLVGLRAARKPPDDDHPYGHRKYETLAAAGIFVFLLFVVVEVLRAAVSRLSGGAPARVTALSFGVMLVTLGINLFVVRYEAGRGRTLHSELLMADALHTRSDVLTSCAVLVSLASVRMGYPLVDPIGALLVAVFIARTGLEIARQTSPILADHAVLDEEGIRRVVMSVPDVVGCHQIRSRGSADYAFVDLHVWFHGSTSLNEAHRLSHVVKDRLMEAYPQIADAIIHIEPPPNEIPQT